MTCEHCCAEVTPGEVCTYCGCLCEPEKPESQSAQDALVLHIGNKSKTRPKRRKVAVRLCCFGLIGIYGLHWIYLGRRAYGIFWSLVCMLLLLAQAPIWPLVIGISVLSSLVDLLRLMKKTAVDWDGKLLV